MVSDIQLMAMRRGDVAAVTVTRLIGPQQESGILSLRALLRAPLGPATKHSPVSGKERP